VLPRRALDIGLALVLLVIGESQVLAGWNDGGVGAVTHSHHLARAVLVVFFVAPLAWRRVWPLAVVAVTCLAMIVQLTTVAAYVPFLSALLPMAIGNYTAAAYARRSRWVSLLLVFATEAVIYARIPAERVGGEVLFAGFVALGTWVAGDVVRARLSRADRAVEAARLVVAENEAAAAVALAEERAQIARELHDVIAHTVSVMGVQAGAARTLIESDPQAATTALLAVEAAARSSVTELQRLLAVLRQPAGTPDDRSPQPGLAQLPALVEQVRAAGLPVELSATGTAELSPGVDLAAYRIVQEALTNALKYARAPTAVRVRYADGRVEIEVRDAGRAYAAKSQSTGHGLVGSRERATLYGGTFDAQPHPDGGFVVRASLPIATGAQS
jgi:signal transduction histidine kinase